MLREHLLLVGLAVPLFFVGLGAYPLDVKGEPREAVTAREVRSGDVLLPRLNGESLPEKPLVFPWLVALSLSVTGEGGEWGPRLPSALAATGLVFVVAASGRRLLGARGGTVAGALSATTALVSSLGRRARVDMTLAFFHALALHLFLSIVDDAERGERPGGRPLGRVAALWLALAFATLTKGPFVGAGLPVLVALAWLAATKRLALVSHLRPLPGLGLFLLVAAPWYANGILREGSPFLHRALLMENVLMAVGADEGGGHAHGPLYLLRYLPTHLAPWSLFLPAALFLAHRDAAWRSREVSFPLAWLLAMLLVFSASAGKRPDYLLPLCPAAALLVARPWVRLLADPGRPWERTALAVSCALGAIACGVAAVAFPLLAPRLRPADHAAVDAVLDEVLARPWAMAVVALAACGTTVVPFVLVRCLRPRAALAAIVLSTTALVLAAALVVLPISQARSSYAPFAREIARVAGARAVEQHGVWDFQVQWYSGRRLATLDRDAFVARVATPGALVVTPRRSLAALPGEVLRRVRVLAASHRPDDPPESDLCLVEASRPQ